MKSWLQFCLLCFYAALAPAAAASTLPAQGRVSAYFSPADEPQKILQALIEQAQQEIYLQAYVFTSRPLARALAAAVRRGVRVRVLLDGKMHRRGNKAVQAMLEQGVELMAQHDFAAAHNKVLLIDPDSARRCTVVTGSYNFTWSAEHRNAENILVVEAHCELVRRYLENWQRCEQSAVPVHAFPLAKK